MEWTMQMNLESVDIEKVFYDGNTLSFVDNKKELPISTSKTAYVGDLIVELLKAVGDNYVKHKLLVQALEGVLDKKTNKPLFTRGNINSGFNVINQKRSKYGVIKDKFNGGVYYKYTINKFSLLVEDIVAEKELDKKIETKQLKEDLISKIVQVIDLNNTYKKRLLFENEKISDNTLSLLEKIADLEIFILKNRNIL